MVKRKTSKRENKPSQSSFLSIKLVALGILFILFSVLLMIPTKPSLLFSGEYNKTESSKEKITPLELSIDKIGVSSSVYPTQITNRTWEISEKGASYLESSPGIGQKGSIVIYDHNTEGKFKDLSKLKTGDKITIEGADRKTYAYVVKEIKIVNPTDIRVLTEDSSENLILYTCYGLFNSQRLIIKAIPSN